MGLWDDCDDSVKISDRLPNLKPGNYLVAMQGGKDFEARSGLPYMKMFGTVLLVTEDLGDSSPPGEEIGIPIFRDKRYKYFEAETKAFVRASLNLEKDEANALKMIAVRRFLVGTAKSPGSKLPGRVLELKVREVAGKDDEASKEKNKDRDPLVRITPLRALTAEEVKAAVPSQLLKKVFPNGPKSIVGPEVATA